MSHRNIFYYDNRDNLTCVRDPDLGLTYYTYDAGSRMTSVKNPFGEVTYYEYSPGGRLQKRTLGNGAVTYYEYDAIGRTSKVENRKSDMTVISSFDYDRDAAGNPVSIQREDGYTVYYEYDAKHQLTAETHVDEGSEIYAWEWDYDAAGNREYEDFNGEVTYYEYNAGNELVSETSGEDTTYYEYDRCGNTTAKQEPAGTTYYHWDHENLMTQLDLPDGSHNYFAYDADSKRVQKQDSEGFTEFIYQGPDMLKLQQERDEAGDTKAQYTMGNGLEAMRRADGGDITTGESSFYHFDQLGSTFNLTDENEAITDTYLYNAWGEVFDRTGTTTNPHTYVGKERYYRAADAMLYLLGLRYCAQALGRFLTRDPLVVALEEGFTGFLMRHQSSTWLARVEAYLYARNECTRLTDPGGRWPKDCLQYLETGDDEAEEEMRDTIEDCWRDCLRSMKACVGCLSEELSDEARDKVCKFIACWRTGRSRGMPEGWPRPGNEDQSCAEAVPNDPLTCEDCCDWDWYHGVCTAKYMLKWEAERQKWHVCATCCNA